MLIEFDFRREIVNLSIRDFYRKKLTNVLYFKFNRNV